MGWPAHPAQHVEPSLTGHSNQRQMAPRDSAFEFRQGAFRLIPVEWPAGRLDTVVYPAPDRRVRAVEPPAEIRHRQVGGSLCPREAFIERAHLGAGPKMLSS